MTLTFLDTSGNRRLAMFTKVLSLMAATSEDPDEVYRSILALVRQAFDARCYVEVNNRGLKPDAYRISRIWMEDGREAVPDQTPWRLDDVPIRQGGVIAEILARAEPGAVNNLLWAKDDPAYADLGQYGSVVAVPGGMGEWQNWVFTFDRTIGAFTPEDVEVMVLRTNLIGLSLKNLRVLGDLRIANKDIEAEVDRIAAIQKSLLPPERPDVPGLDVAARSETFDRAGGDLYDYAEMQDGRWGFMVADASGHGPSAAVVISMVNAILHTFAVERVMTPARVMDFANAQLISRPIEQSFVTALMSVWDPKTRTLTYTRAGHPPAMIRRGRSVEQMNAVGELPLAVFEDVKYTQHVSQLERGDVVVMFTDGLVEAINETAEMFGEEGLIAAIEAADPTSAEAVLEGIWQAVIRHQAGGTPRDDQTVLVLRVR